MDTITIQDLEVHYHIGVPDEERVQAQRLLITVVMETDTRPAAERDDLTRTIDYYEVSRRLLGLGQGRSWKLLETLADEIATRVLGEFGASHVQVEIRKFIIPEARHVSVRIRRSA